LALEAPDAPGHAFNIGSGRSVSVLEVAAALAEVMAIGGLEPDITRKFRVGDIRHCFADIGLARAVLGYEPRVSLEEGLQELGEWIRTQRVHDHAETATRELAERGLRL
jgi:dTDP-L-rhamnose 4-epimerase